MNSLNDQVKLLVKRFMDLSPQVRMRVSGKLLRLADEAEGLKKTNVRGDSCSRPSRKSFLEQFWAEVERAHGDGRYPTNPFTDKGTEGLRIIKAEQYLLCV